MRGRAGRDKYAYRCMYLPPEKDALYQHRECRASNDCDPWRTGERFWLDAGTTGALAARYPVAASP